MSVDNASPATSAEPGTVTPHSPALIDPDTLAKQVLAGTPATSEQGLAILRTADEDLLDVVAAAARVRRKHFGMTVKVNYLVNLKSGLCPEDCGYCSQRLGSDTEILKYSWLSTKDATRQATFGMEGGAGRVCLVASGRGPSNRDIDRVGEITKSIKDNNPQLEVCACLGFLKDNQAERLKEYGVDAYNHNLNTAESNYEEICSTHTFEQRTDTVKKAKAGGLSPCSGLIVGMGESDEQVIEAIDSLRELDSDSIPVNFLIPFEGTPMEGVHHLTPQHSMRILAAVRFMCPDKELRIAGGREMHLRTLQPLSLHVANSLFLGDYLTSEGQDAIADLDMIVDGGFSILGQEDTKALRDQILASKNAHLAAVNGAQGGTEVGGAGAAGRASGAAGAGLPCAGGAGARAGGSAGGAVVAGQPGAVPAGTSAEAADGAAPTSGGCPKSRGEVPGTPTVPVIRRRGAGTDLPPNA